jgi:hypothetical protein
MSQDSRTPAEFVDPDDLPNNTSANTHFGEVLDRGLNRRGLLKGGLGGAMAAMFAPMAAVSLTACGGGDDDVVVSPTAAPAESLLGFTAVARTLADTNTVPPATPRASSWPAATPWPSAWRPTRTTAPTPTTRSAWATATTASSTSA